MLWRYMDGIDVTSSDFQPLIMHLTLPFAQPAESEVILGSRKADIHIGALTGRHSCTPAGNGQERVLVSRQGILLALFFSKLMNQMDDFLSAILAFIHGGIYSGKPAPDPRRGWSSAPLAKVSIPCQVDCHIDFSSWDRMQEAHGI